MKLLYILIIFSVYLKCLSQQFQHIILWKWQPVKWPHPVIYNVYEQVTQGPPDPYFRCKGWSYYGSIWVFGHGPYVKIGYTTNTIWTTMVPWDCNALHMIEFRAMDTLTGIEGPPTTNLGP